MSFSSPTGMASPKANISGYKTRNTPNFTPQQMQLFAQLLGGTQQGLGSQGGGLDFLSGLASGDEESFAQSEAPSYTAFNKLLGQIGNRYANAGALNSSGFQNATSGAAGELAESLGAKRQGIQQGAIERLLGLSENLLGQKPFDTSFEKKRTGWDTGGDIASIIGKLLPLFL